MKNMNNKSIIYSLGILAILTLVVITIPVKEATAAYNGFYNTYNEPRLNRSNYTRSASNQYISNTASAEGYISTPTDYSNAPIVHSNSPQTSTRTVAGTSTSSSVPKENTVSNNDYSDLAASAILGTNSFMPSGLVQWILFAIFILLVVILVRRVTGKEEQYHAEPLKHA